MDKQNVVNPYNGMKNEELITCHNIDENIKRSRTGKSRKIKVD